MKKVFVSTVQIAIEAEDLTDAQDAMSGFLSEKGVHGGYILDWGYTQKDGEYSIPEEVSVDVNDYEEGEAFVS